MMRGPVPILLLLLALLQYPLWLGKGGYLRVFALEREVAMAQDAVIAKTKRNAALLAEVDGLKESDAALEERARFELGMIGADEQFVRID